MPKAEKTKLSFCIGYRAVYLALLTYAVVVAAYGYVLTGFWPAAYTEVFGRQPSSLLPFSYLTNFLCYALGIFFLADAATHFSSGRRLAESTAFKLKFYALIAAVLNIVVSDFFILVPFSAEWLAYVHDTNALIVVQSEIFRVWGPALFIADYFLFDKKGTLNLFDPFLSLLMPFLYTLYVMLRVPVARAMNDSYIYPYYFLNPNPEGVGTIGMVILVLLGFAYATLVMGVAFWGLDRFLGNRAERTEGLVPVYKASMIVGFQASAWTYAALSAFFFVVLLAIAVSLDLMPADTIIVWISAVMSGATLLPLLPFAFEYETKLRPFLEARKTKGRPFVGTIEFISGSYMSSLYRELFVSYRKNAMLNIAPIQNPLPFFMARSFKPGDKLELYFPEIGSNPIAVRREKKDYR